MSNMPVIIRQTERYMGPIREQVHYAHELVKFESICRTDYWGEEYFFTGNYDIKIEPGAFDNLYNYTGRLEHRRAHYYDKRQRKRVWRSLFDLRLSFNQHGHKKNICEVKGVTKQQAAKICVRRVLQFEKTSYFRETVWPKVLHRNNVTHIFKDFGKDGVLWVASAYSDSNPVTDRIGGRYPWSGSPALGHGHFYKYRLNFHIPFHVYTDMKDLDDIDYEKHGVYEKPRVNYTHVHGSGYSGGGKIDTAIIEEIEAQLDMSNLVYQYHLRDRAQAILDKHYTRRY